MDYGETAKLASDLVLFAASDNDTPRVLLVKRREHPYIDHWALPGGLLEPGERFEAAARRELTEGTGVSAPDDIVEVGPYGDPTRDPRGRVVSVAYAAVVPRVMRARASSDARAVAWMPVTTALGNTRLAFDHDKILADAVRACGLDVRS
jgi:8-oxo-dGTP diphosphatase